MASCIRGRIMKVLIAFFSMTKDYSFGKVERLAKGHTEQVADQIHALIESDLYRMNKVEAIDPRREYIPARILDFAQYDVVYLGFPIYYHTMPVQVAEFIKSYDFAGKMILLFTTHGGSGLGRSVEKIKLMCPQAKVLDGLAVGSAEVLSAKDKIKKWALASFHDCLVDGF